MVYFIPNILLLTREKNPTTGLYTERNIHANQIRAGNGLHTEKNLAPNEILKTITSAESDFFFLQ